MLRPSYKWAVPIFWIFVVPLIAHLLFSWIGYNPTDDGFILSYSRRLLEGQIPHLDFISIRPVGSALLHLPIVAFGGEATYWISRLVVWVQFGCIAWIWNFLYQKVFETSLSITESFFAGFVIFAFSVNNFPIMAWHSSDALFFATIGFGICMGTDRKYKFLGYCILGLAYLSRQNFIFLIPIALFILGDWKRIQYWIAAAVPGLLYVAYLLTVHAFSDAVLQMSSQGAALIDTGILPYLSVTVIGGFTFGIIVNLLRRRPPSSKTASIIMMIIIFSIGIGLPLNLFQDLTFFLFGLTGGLLVYDVQLKRTKRVQIGLLSLAITWCISISLGYNYPALASGTLAAYVLYNVFSLYQNEQRNSSRKVFVRLILGSIVVFLLTARLIHIYRGHNWLEAKQPLSDVYPGAKYIQVDTNTYAFLADMKEAIQQAGDNYALIPDMAGYWAASEQINPLPIDWAVSVELNNAALMDRVTNTLDKKRGTLVIIVQKVVAEAIAYEEQPISTKSNIYPIIDYVQMHFEKTGETRYFELYQ